jgi:arginine N-succinyltransferase
MAPDFVLRPVGEHDLPGLRHLADVIQDGLTTLPPEDSALEDRIDQSLRAFDRRIKKAGGDHYLFVLEEVGSGGVVGTSGIIARVGGFDPFYTYEVRRERLVHQPLGIDHEMDVLHLKLDHKGPSEVCTLSLRPEFRRAGRGLLLSLSRFLFMACFPQRFDERVIAELRGFTNEAGLSPFWEAIGRHFFAQSFARADFLSGIGQKDFIRDLMPKYPIYAATLPEEARAVIGRVHRDAEPALKILLSQARDLRSKRAKNLNSAKSLLYGSHVTARFIWSARLRSTSEPVLHPWRLPKIKRLSYPKKPLKCFRSRLAIE